LSWPQEDERITQPSYVYPRRRYDAEAFNGLAQAKFHFQSAKRVDYTKVHCPNAENAVGRWIGFPQNRRFSSESDMGDFIAAIAKIKQNLDELRLHI